MGNQNFGDFAGAFANSFTQTLNAKRDGQRKDKFAKLQAQLVELQLGNAKTVEEAQTLVKKMMGGSVEEFQPAAPIQTPGGRDIPQFSNASQAPMSLTEMLATGQGTNALMQSGMVSGGDILKNEGIAASRKQTEELMNRFFPAGGGGAGGVGGVGNGMVPSGVTIGPDGRPQISFAPSPAQAPLDVTDASAFVHPETGAPMPPGGTAEQYLAMGAVTTGQYQVRQKLKKTGVDIQTDFHKYQEAISLMTDLEGTLSASGVPFGEFVRMGKGAFASIGATVGLDTKEIATQNEKRDRLKKLLASNMIGSLDQLSEAGTMTNAKFQQLQAATADMGNEADANAKVFADLLEASMQGADQIGAKFEGRAEMQKFIDDIRGGSESTSNNKIEPVVDAPGMFKAIAQFSEAQLEALGANAEILTDEVKRAMADRWEELNGDAE